MSTPITIEDYHDLPCEDWKDTPMKVDECPMKEKWHEGETRECWKCGWFITFQSNKP